MPKNMESGNLLQNFSNNLADLVELTGRSIVSVNAHRRMSTCGVHWRQGLIVTVEHGIQQEENIDVKIADGRTLNATLVGRDSGTDLALLQVPELDLAPINIGDDRAIKIGHMVLAIARDSDRDLSASLGILSNRGDAWRSWTGGKIDQFLRPSFMLYPGFAGSALVNMDGQAIGINTIGPRRMTITIPTSTVDRVINQLLEGGSVKRGYLGLGMQSVYLPDSLVQSLNLSSNRGVIIVSVEPSAAADRAGMILGDTIVSMNGQVIEDISDVQALLDSDSIGKPLTAQIIRGGNLLELTITVAEKPSYDEERQHRHRRGRRG
jgi:S1-C subfamily serine protease